ncbi:hypothetical protein CDAR_260151 [Caerostris darwini]|uniref:Uncharacterized protein n=1 Tax=Caerostris darwini TaxID=1538125 RepID=A0AAV4VAE1_9ARAC|nr:hypothetical protein CDAR_260151 [Caerostris darwini]
MHTKSTCIENTRNSRRPSGISITSRPPGKLVLRGRETDEGERQSSASSRGVGEQDSGRLQVQLPGWRFVGGALEWRRPHPADQYGRAFF